MAGNAVCKKIRKEQNKNAWMTQSWQNLCRRAAELVYLEWGGDRRAANTADTLLTEKKRWLLKFDTL